MIIPGHFFIFAKTEKTGELYYYKSAVLSRFKFR